MPGIYAALLEQERAAVDDPHYWDPRWRRLQHADGEYCGMPGVVCDHEPPPPRFRRTRHLLDALEARQPVTVATWDVPRGIVPDAWRRQHRAYQCV